MLFLSKLLPAFVYPLGLTLTLLALAFVLSFSRFRRSARAVIGLAFLLLYVASMPVVGNLLLARLEWRYPPRPVADHAPADVAILLGGALSPPLPPRVASDLGERADRIVQAWRLWRAGKVKRILVSGGNLPWLDYVAPESELTAALLEELGVPPAAILLESTSRNTYENAVESRRIWDAEGLRSGYLVTSASHMPRALAVFRKAGMPVEPSAADLRARRPLYDSVLDFLPDAEALKRTTDAVRETIGFALYRQRGWL